MGTLQLNCPLCCSESFTSYDSLKCHLINVYENLKCSACDKKFVTFCELIEHIGRECCEDNEKSSYAADSSYEEIIIKQEGSEDSVEEDEEDSTNMLIQTLTDAKVGNQPQEDAYSGLKVKTEVEDVQMYHCSSCDLNFSSIKDHVNQYHKGQDVLLEVHCYADLFVAKLRYTWCSNKQITTSSI